MIMTRGITKIRLYNANNKGMSGRSSCSLMRVRATKYGPLEQGKRVTDAKMPIIRDKGEILA